MVCKTCSLKRCRFMGNRCDNFHLKNKSICKYCHCSDEWYTMDKKIFDTDYDVKTYYNDSNLTKYFGYTGCNNSTVHGHLVPYLLYNFRRDAFNIHHVETKDGKHWKFDYEDYNIRFGDDDCKNLHDEAVNIDHYLGNITRFVTNYSSYYEVIFSDGEYHPTYLQYHEAVDIDKPLQSGRLVLPKNSS